MYGPVRTVVWQGSAGDRRPYADLVAKGLLMIRRTGSARSGERRRARKQVRTATSATDITRYRSAGGAICRLIRVIRWFDDVTSKWMSYLIADKSCRTRGARV